MTRRPEREERARADTDADDAWEAPAWSLHGDGGEYGEGAAPAGPPPGELGRGGAGVVTRGPDRHLPREVAWKRAARDDARLHARLAAEARALAGLEHPNIVPIYDRATGADGELRVALRIIRGDTLEALIRRTPARAHLATRLATLRMRSVEPIDVPPYL